MGPSRTLPGRRGRIRPSPPASRSGRHRLAGWGRSPIAPEIGRTRSRWRELGVAAGVGLLLSAAGPAVSRSSGSALPPIRHVWVIELENAAYGASFADPVADPYLARTLPSQGALLTQYYAIGHDSAANYIAEISGQAPNPATSSDCVTYTGFPSTPAAPRPRRLLADGQLLGRGCVFPHSVATIGNQLTAANLSWRAYQQDMGNLPARDGVIAGPFGPGCGHPPRLGDVDRTIQPSPSDGYATRHDPFMYFQQVIANRGYCAAHVVSLRPLGSNLRRVATTPNFSFISPNTCQDGHDRPLCANRQPGGLPQVDGFLRRWVPVIRASPAYRADGLIIITFDEAAATQTAACCGERVARRGPDPSHPNLRDPGITGPGGGRVGAVLLSPFIRPGTTSARPYNHYGLLRSVEQLFGLAYLGDAAQAGVRAFGRDVYTNWPHVPRARRRRARRGA